MLMLLLKPLHGQCVADSLTGLDLGVGVRGRRWAGTGSSPGLPCYLDSLGARNGRGVGKNNLVEGRGVAALLGVGANYYYTLCLLLGLRLLVGSSYRSCWST